MRRVLLVLTVAALMAAMMVSAGPAKADSFGNESNFNSGVNGVDFGGGDAIGFSFGDFDIGDNDSGVSDVAFLFSSGSELNEFEPAGIDFDF
jgi:hypothetical protein